MIKLLVLTTDSSEESVTPRKDLSEQIAHCREQGLEVILLVDPTRGRLQATLDAEQPTLVYCACRRSIPLGERPIDVFSLLATQGIPWIGSSQGVLRLARDKAACCDLLEERCSGVVLSRDVIESDSLMLTSLAYPVIVKPNDLSGSIGVATSSVAADDQELNAIARDLMGRIPRASSIRIEEYDVRSREFTIGAIYEAKGWYLSFAELVAKAGKHQVYDEAQKRLSYKDRSIKYQRVTEPLRTGLRTLALATLERLRLRDFARLDVIATKARMRVIDVNALPVLTRSLMWEDYIEKQELGSATLLRVTMAAYRRVTAENSLGSKHSNK